MSVPPGTEMFQFPGFASSTYVFSERYPCGWVAPFGYPRINACSRLPVAFRSVPRPSSPPGAKASTECPYRAQNTKHTHRNHPHLAARQTWIRPEPALWSSQAHNSLLSALLCELRNLRLQNMLAHTPPPGQTNPDCGTRRCAPTSSH